MNEAVTAIKKGDVKKVTTILESLLLELYKYSPVYAIVIYAMATSKKSFVISRKFYAIRNDIFSRKFLFRELEDAFFEKGIFWSFGNLRDTQWQIFFSNFA